MIARRAILAAGAFLIANAGSRAQTPARPRRIGVLRPGLPSPEDDAAVSGLERALRDLGHDVGRSLIIDYRYARGELERLPELARALLHDRADVLLVVGTAAALAARDATKVVPIVMFANVDPVRIGVVDSLGRPTGNLTGVLIAPDGSLAAKRLSLLKEAVPQARSIALLAPEGDLNFRQQIAETRAAAAVADVALFVVGDRGGDYLAAFEEIAATGADALIVGAHQYYVRDRRTIIDLAARNRLPAMYEWPDQVREGGFISFGADLSERQRRVAVYIDRLLKGARPSDLPFEQPAALGMTINLKSARALGLRIPDSLLARADEVIE